MTSLARFDSESSVNGVPLELVTARWTLERAVTLLTLATPSYPGGDAIVEVALEHVDLARSILLRHEDGDTRPGDEPDVLTIGLEPNHPGSVRDETLCDGVRAGALDDDLFAPVVDNEVVHIDSSTSSAGPESSPSDHTVEVGRCGGGDSCPCTCHTGGWPA